MNAKMEKITKERGYDDTKTMLTELLEKFGSGAAIAEEIGVTATCVNIHLRRLGLNNSYVRKRRNLKKRLHEWNEKHNTNFQNTKDFLAHMYLQYGGKTAAILTGANANYIRQCAVDREIKEGKKDPELAKYRDSRGPSIPGPWKDTTKSPCTGWGEPCKFVNRDKNEPGCVNCPRRLEYIGMLEGDDYPHVSGNYRPTIPHEIGMITPNTWNQVF